MPSVLVIDDDQAIQEMLTHLLSEAGYAVETCRDGRKVIAQLEAKRFDLVILDVLIPHMNGFTVIEQIRSHPTLRQLPVIMISGIYRSRNHKSEMSSRWHIVDYLDKPLATARLLELVAGAAGKPDESTIAKRPAAAEPAVAEQPKSHLVEPAAQEERLQVEEAAREDFQTSAFILQGSIRRNPVPAVLGKLWRVKRSGALLLRNGKVKKIVYVKKGEPYAVKSNLVSECLGQLLVGERLIGEEECARSIELMRETRRRQGEILVEMRCITERNLEFALELQLETKIFDTFRWDDGDFRFNGSIDLPPPSIELEWRGGAMVAEGIRRAYDETRLRSLMLPILDVPLSAIEPLPELGELRLEPREQAAAETILTSLPRSSRSLLDGGGELDPPDMLRVLYTLIALEILGPRS